MVVLCIWLYLAMAAIKSSGYQIQHLAVDNAQAVFFRKIFCADDGKHGESKKLEGGRMKWNPPTRCATPA